MAAPPGVLAVAVPAPELVATVATPGVLVEAVPAAPELVAKGVLEAVKRACVVFHPQPKLAPLLLLDCTSEGTPPCA